MEPPPRVLLLTDPRMQKHHAAGHPERPERLAAAIAGVEAGAAAVGAELLRRDPRPATDDQISAVHDPAYLAALTRAVEAGGGWLDADTYLGPGSLKAARLAAGATIDAALAVRSGEAVVAFAAVRPPGHHASRERGSGFCLLNNIAIAVAALRSTGVQRIGIVDWDVHHGDGTQAIFATDAQLCYASTHQSPLFPGSGAASEQGIGDARGTKHNVPLPPGSDDEAFVAAWRDQLLPAISDFGAEAILVSAGYDAALADPLAECAVSDAGYRAVATALGALAARLPVRGVALTLEGGYDLPSVASGVAATLVGVLDGMRVVGGAHLYSGSPRRG